MKKRKIEIKNTEQKLNKVEQEDGPLCLTFELKINMVLNK